MSSHPLFPIKNTDKSISTTESLCKTLSITTEELHQVCKLKPDEKYRKKKVPKSSGGVRTVYDPTQLLRTIQSRINNRIFNSLIDWPGYLYGSLPNEDKNGRIYKRDYIACAQKHCLSKSLLKIDIENFYDNIHSDYIYEIFHTFFHYPEDVSKKLTDICCLENFLVQGALTSSYLATLCFWNSEGCIVKKLSRKGLTYTRLMDDITVSSKKHDYNFNIAQQLIESMLLKKELPVNPSKTRIIRAGLEPLYVHGLRVNYNTPRLPSSEIKNIRAAVHNVINLAKINNYRTTLEYRRLFNRTMGRVNKLSRVGHNKHKILKEKLSSVTPLPSRLDILKTENLIKFLERNTQNSNNLPDIRIKYKRRINISTHRLNIISKSFPSEAEKLKNKLNSILNGPTQ